VNVIDAVGDVNVQIEVGIMAADQRDHVLHLGTIGLRVIALQIDVLCRRSPALAGFPVRTRSTAAIRTRRVGPASGREFGKCTTQFGQLRRFAQQSIHVLGHVVVGE
jgi:hypothetical protein